MYDILVLEILFIVSFGKMIIMDISLNNGKTSHVKIMSVLIRERTKKAIEKKGKNWKKKKKDPMSTTSSISFIYKQLSLLKTRTSERERGGEKKKRRASKLTSRNSKKSHVTREEIF